MWDLSEDIKNTKYSIKPYKRWNKEINDYKILWRVKFGMVVVKGFETRELALGFIKEDWQKKKLSTTPA